MSNKEIEVDDEELTANAETEVEEPVGSAAEEVEVATEATETTEDEATKAKSHGYKGTLEEFVAAGGDPKDFKTAKEFNLTGEVIDLKKTLQKRDRDIEEILKYNKQVIENHKQEMRQKLQEQLAQAKANGDVDAVEKIKDVQYKQEADNQQEVFSRINEERKQFDEDFVSRNSSWFNVPELKARSIEINNRVLALRPSITYPELLKEIEDQMKYELSTKPEYTKYSMLESERTTPRLNLSSTKSAMSKSTMDSHTDDSTQFAKLDSNKKYMFGILKRINEQAQKHVDPKDRKPYTVTRFLTDMKKDEEF